MRAIALLGVILLSSGALGQDLDKGAKALNMISDFANKLCNNPELKGKSSSIDVQGKAKAEASKLVKQLAELNVEGAAKFTSNDYEGLLQKDLLPALQDAGKCKQKVFDDLKDRFLPAPGQQSTSRADPTSPFAIVLACIKDDQVKIGSWTFPLSDVDKNARYSQLVALVEKLPNRECESAGARVLRMKDEVALDPRAKATATSGGNTGVILLPKSVVDALEGEHIAFTRVHMTFKNSRR